MSVAEQIEKAQDTLRTLCKDPSSFRMSIPANIEEDTDLIIANALRYANQMRIALEKIADSPIPCNEIEMQSWYVTASEIASKALSGILDE